MHAGIDLDLKDWHQTSDYQKVWLREPLSSGIQSNRKDNRIWSYPNFLSLSERPGTSRLWRTQDQKLVWMVELSMVEFSMEFYSETRAF